MQYNNIEFAAHQIFYRIKITIFRLCGIYCSRLQEVCLITCMLLDQTKVSGPILVYLPAGRSRHRVVLPYDAHFGNFEVITGIMIFHIILFMLWCLFATDKHMNYPFSGVLSTFLTSSSLFLQSVVSGSYPLGTRLTSDG